MGDIVLVPIHLDALHLQRGQSVTEARANFDRLPYFDGKRDVYSNTVNLSESIVSKPFQNQNLYLKSGIHLHWALPNVLTTGVQGKSSIEFPAAPNRWLIIRRQNDKETGKWIVESDYLHPPENGHQEDSITYPVTYPDKDPSKCKEAPRFCYLGRQLTWSQWLKKKDQLENRYLDQITAIGYGETTFAAFYPNCRSVFGFYDSFDGNFTSAKNLEYDVIGWYGNSGQDYSRNIAENFETSDQFKQFEQDFTDNQILEQIKAEGFLQYLRDTNQTYLLGIVKDKTTPFTAEKDKSYCIQQIRMYLCQGLKASLLSKLKWDIRDLKTLDNQMICYARLAFADNFNISHNRQSEKVSLAVGNTGGEALAAYLANRMAKDQASQKTIIEEQLALIDLTDSIDSLNSDRPDFGAIFQQRQHQNSFNALAGGLIWEIAVTRDSNQPENNNNSASPISLPQHLMEELNQLNQKQRAYNRDQEVIDSMRYQLFSDWYKYMVSCYPLDTWDNYPDLDEIKSYIETCGLDPLKVKIASKGELQLKQDDTGNWQVSSALVPNAKSNPTEPKSYYLAEQINRLLGEIKNYNEQCNDYQGILLHLKLDRLLENAQNQIVEDISGKNHQITTKGNPSITSQEKFGRCLLFNNDQDCLQIESLQGSGKQISIAIWITVPNKHPDSVICQCDAAKLSLRIRDGKYQFGSSQNTGNFVGAEGAIAQAEIGTWVHLTGTYDGQTWRLYKHGQEIASQANPGNSSLIETCWGQSWAIASSKNGQMAHLRIYNRTLSSKEVLQIVDNLTKVTFKLEQIADARYWQSKEPVVLIVKEKDDQDSTNNALKATDRYDRNELLGCTALSDKTIEDLIKENFQPVVDKIDSLSKNLPTEGKPKFWGLKTWSKQPWNPFLLEWLVEFFPLEAPAKSNSLRRYGSNFLTDNYILAEHDFELSPKSNYQVPISEEKQLNHIVTDKDFNTYNGSSILTPYVALALQQKLDELAKKYPAQAKDADAIENPVYKAIVQCEKNLDPNDPQSRDRQLEAYIRARIPHNYPDYTKAIKIDKDDFFSDKDNLTNLKKWYETNELKTIPSFSKTVSDAQAQLSKVHCLSQALGGFNAALLMHKQTLQLNIQDPIGFLDYRKFTTKVRRAIANCNAVAPQPLDRFNPVRSGEIKVINLRLIDTFGQVKDLTYPEAVIVPKTLKSEQPARVYLPPRIVQPARINFDWLPAEASSLDSNFTPICGWIVPNNLDHSLFIYSNTGQALGSIEQNGKWMYAPGNLQMELEDIPNPHLKKMVNKLCELGKQEQKNFIKYFAETLNNALENIELEQSAQTNVASLLVGRPIALVRASINLELRGLPAVNQNWQIFRQDMQLERKNESSGDRRNSQTERETDGFTEINVPIRVGEYQQFNDGVLGYWKETPIETEKGKDYVYEHDIFYAQQSDTVESAHIETQYWNPDINKEIEEAPINVIQTLDGAAQTISMLIDPYHSVHVSAGILPTKVVSIPPEQYVPIIQAIQVAFLTSPLLSDRDSYNFPLPKIPQHFWTWLEKQQDQWDRVYDFPAIDKSVWLKYLPFWQKSCSGSILKDLENSWQSLIEAGWLIETPGETPKAAIAHPDSQDISVVKLLTGSLIGRDETIAAFLKSYSEDCWQLLISAGWLTEIPGQPIKAAITDPKNRPKNSDDDQAKPLTGLLESLEQEIDLFFALYQVDLIPATIQANFTQTQQIREGWLVLKKVKDR